MQVIGEVAGILLIALVAYSTYPDWISYVLSFICAVGSVIILLNVLKKLLGR